MPRVALAAVLLLALPMQAATRRAVAKAPYVPLVRHVFIVILENTDEAVAEDLPFFKELSRRGALLENFHGLSHPSQPNYIGLTAGSRYGVVDDTPTTIYAPNLADLVEASGLTWKAYAENFPGDCFLGSSAGTKDGGMYVRRHEPFIEFADIQTDAERCNAHIVNADELDADIASGKLPAFSFYTPNNQHNGHDSSAAAADTWLQNRFGSLLDDPRFMDGTVFIVTYDESSSKNDMVSTVLVGDAVQPGTESADWLSHYNLLKTIEELLGLGNLGKADSFARAPAGIWK